MNRSSQVHFLRHLILQSTGNWFYKSVKKLFDECLVEGYRTNGVIEFRPNNPINRVEFLKLVLIAELGSDAFKKLPEPSVNPFPDVHTTNWFAPAVAYAVSSNIVIGFTNGPFSGTFRPGDEVTREQAVKILVTSNPGLSELYNSITNNPENLPEEFPDVTNSTHWSYYFIYTAKATNVVSGYDTGLFGPTDSIKRSEAAKIICTTYFGQKACIE
ncbi:MAG: hypothetical protein GKR87_13760 [Kiritimatiellae bacterium]|nr:hypothetical protein [Kiritimatiellia bacterium]